MTTVDARSPGLDVPGDLVPGSLADRAGDAHAARAEVAGRTRDAYRALFEDVPAGGLTVTERFTTAVRVAATQHDTRLTGHYQVTAGRCGVSAGLLAAALWGQVIESPPRLAAIWRHADLLATHPARVTAADVHRLTAVGLDAGAVVTLTQMAGFVAYQTRVLTGLRLLGVPSADLMPTATDLGSAGTAQGYSRQLPAWRPWLPPVDDAGAARLAASVPARVLAREPHISDARAALDEAVFGAEGGLPAAERELAAMVASMVNGSAFCVASHAVRAARLSGRADDVDRLLAGGLAVPRDERWRAIVDLAAALSQPRPAATAAHVARLRAAGLDDVAVLDVVHATASLGWANRLVLGLGEVLRGERP